MEVSLFYCYTDSLKNRYTRVQTDYHCYGWFIVVVDILCYYLNNNKLKSIVFFFNKSTSKLYKCQIRKVISESTNGIKVQHRCKSGDFCTWTM